MSAPMNPRPDDSRPNDPRAVADHHADTNAGHAQAVDVLIVAGGTGGHIYPAVALAERLRTQGQRVLWLGSTRGLEREVARQTGLALRELEFTGLRGRGLAAYVGLPWRLAKALGRCMGLLGTAQPRLVVCFGGYITVPLGLAARLRGLPIFVHEQNAVMGSANRLLQRWAARVFVGFANTRHARADAEAVGIPIRQGLLNAVAAPGGQRGSQRPLHLLVVGGSLGAMALNRAVPAALARMGEAARAFKVWHQTGRQPGAAEQVEKAYAATSAEVERVAPYIDDMGQAYAWADVVVGRAGAATVAELQTLRMPCVLVPLPTAIDDHQTANAQALVREGLGVCVPQNAQIEAGLANALGRDFPPKGPAPSQSDATERMAAAVLQALNAKAPGLPPTNHQGPTP